MQIGDSLSDGPADGVALAAHGSSHIHGQQQLKPNRPTRTRPRPVRIEPLPRKAMNASPMPTPEQIAELRSIGQNHDGRRRRLAWTMDDSRRRRSSASRSGNGDSDMGLLLVDRSAITDQGAIGVVDYLGAFGARGGISAPGA